MLPFFRLIDRYILGELLKPFLAGVVAFMIIMISNTLYIFMELILKSNIGPATVGRMLLFNLPAIVVVTLPVAYMFATLLALGRLGRDSEIIALRAVGVSLTRAIAPIILMAIFISGLGWFLQERVVPWSNQQTVEILKDMMKRDTLQAVKERQFISADNRNFYVQSIDRKKNLLKGIYVMDRSKGGYPQIITAETGTRKDTKWILNKGVLRKLDAQGFIDHEIRFERMEIEMNLKPEMIFNNQLDVRQLASGEAAKLIDEKRKRGEDTRRDEMDYHTKFSLPLATFFTILLAAPIGIRFSKMGNYFGVAISIALVFIWYLAYSTFTNLGSAGTVHPVLAAWVQNLAFGLAGVLLLLQMQGVKVFTILFWPLLVVVRPFREAVRGRPVSKDPDDRPQVVETSPQERRKALLLHLLALPGFLLFPALFWLRQRRRSAFLELNAREVLNFHFSFVLYLLLELAFSLGLAWVFLIQTEFPLPALPFSLTSEHFFFLALGFAGLTSLFALVASLSAALRVRKSQLYHYPLAIPFLKAKPHLKAVAQTGPLVHQDTGPLAAPELQEPAPQSESSATEGVLLDAPVIAQELQVEVIGLSESLPGPAPEAVQPRELSAQAAQALLEIEAAEIYLLPGSGWSWRKTRVAHEEPARIRVWQRGGWLARLALLGFSLLLLLLAFVGYEQTQTFQLSFFCQDQPQKSCVFQEQGLLRSRSNVIPADAIRDVLVIPRQLKSPEGKEPQQLFDIVLQTTQTQIWIKSEKEEPAAHILAGNIRLFLQGFAPQAPRVEQRKLQPLLIFAGGWLGLSLLVWLLWPLRWRREFALNRESLTLRKGRRVFNYPRHELGELVLEPGWLDLQTLILNWRPQAGDEQSLVLASQLNPRQAEALLEELRPWLKAAPVEDLNPIESEMPNEPEDETQI
ncbi:hypothetical protein COW36_10010 [bacterium (Candidatus Blackallbacteria) CG17_big_fil_post_rev_8_21_14_2_50_48_46]|uniref:Lipopolysaccharide export system permease protein LptF n=1 Tax=bacterium (Candidatus Blackallbacteria) CG17_big_fil_post_rev_8_21_14_2_50_48_46 TaxID=2014261 RepID=A0A2M7G5A5_9BACT|nr:MAG: hypothetical protein COW64_13885 [bacterium (Candidatus Blackallbacteria) CG18_big_fil_WC_8_21_14_2_50_49_26]PIW17133.1 MAG: hypothetical protein COW36_10010 [bacterium (Candidatus Blackallbacteria) CG17_big_fil_post_rev_8_21_14_2_50_48_46]PIW47827.1 MAG: hypothetical protein COW20_11240 [bacterium (Candidatus Blackallbacteria) CG13_big_fil_rev_8_21_14_2_50_49_14]